jgi:hypothetical protein
MVPAVDKLNAAGIPVTNVNERLAGGSVITYVETDDHQLALARRTPSSRWRFTLSPIVVCCPNWVRSMSAEWNRQLP